MHRVGAILVAAGRSSRMNGIDKVFVPLAGRPLIAHPLATLQSYKPVDVVVLVTAADRVGEAAALVEAYQFSKVCNVVAGGERRQDSVLAGLARLQGVDVVIVHDGARPFLTDQMLSAGLEAALQTGAAIAALPIVETLKEVGDDGLIRCTVPRERLWAVQTPQVFRRELLLRAHAVATADVTDDAMLVEALGIGVRIFPGSRRNIKVTTPDDLALAEALLRGTGKVDRGP